MANSFSLELNGWTLLARLLLDETPVVTEAKRLLLVPSVIDVDHVLAYFAIAAGNAQAVVIVKELLLGAAGFF